MQKKRRPRVCACVCALVSSLLCVYMCFFTREAVEGGETQSGGVGGDKSAREVAMICEYSLSFRSSFVCGWVGCGARPLSAAGSVPLPRLLPPCGAAFPFIPFFAPPSPPRFGAPTRACAHMCVACGSRLFLPFELQISLAFASGSCRLRGLCMCVCVGGEGVGLSLCPLVCSPASSIPSRLLHGLPFWPSFLRKREAPRRPATQLLSNHTRTHVNEEGGITAKQHRR